VDIYGDTRKKGGSAVHLKVIGSSSKGNSYVLRSDTGTLLIECGVPFKQIQKAVNFDISNIQGCLISHEHL
jgi:phosphoribosyl 1,2-cyclic phosphodiesterase